jgi:hypothetical protein
MYHKPVKQEYIVDIPYKKLFRGYAIVGPVGNGRNSWYLSLHIPTITIDHATRNDTGSFLRPAGYTKQEEKIKNATRKVLECPINTSLRTPEFAPSLQHHRVDRWLGISIDLESGHAIYWDHIRPMTVGRRGVISRSNISDI